jgi:DNA polymerase
MFLTLDFETYYSQEFSLTKMTTEEYIRSDQFEVIGVAVAVDDQEPVWFSGDREAMHQFLAQYDWENSVAIAHNAQFDGAILNWIFGIKPKAWSCTLCMGRALVGTEVGGSLKVLAQHYNVGIKGTEVDDAKGYRRCNFTDEALARYGEYCKNDVKLTFNLFMLMQGQIPRLEHKLIDLTVRMFTEPVLKLSLLTLEKHLSVMKIRREELLENFSEEDLMSNDKFAKLLQGFGVSPPRKISKTTGKEAWALAKTDEEFKALLEHSNPEVQTLVAARLGVRGTLEETRTQRFIEIAKRGTLPVMLRYYAAHTGRWGGDDKVNLQNLPRNSMLKFAIKAPEGYVMVDSDSSQIEARTLAWLAGQDDLVRAFDRGEDVYKLMASSIYGKAEKDITKEERFVGKTTILGAGYGMGSEKFKNQLKTFGVEIEAEEAKRIIDTYRRTYPQIVALWKSAGDSIKAILQNKHSKLGILEVEGKKGIKLPNGLYINYSNLRKQTTADDKVEYLYDTKKGKQFVHTKIYGGKVVENICQALARIIIGEQMLMINKKYKVVMTVHDAVACIVPKDEVKTAQEYVELCMRIRPQWATKLPLNCESGYGVSYGEC